MMNLFNVLDENVIETIILLFCLTGWTLFFGIMFYYVKHYPEINLCNAMLDEILMNPCDLNILTLPEELTRYEKLFKTIPFYTNTKTCDKLTSIYNLGKSLGTVSIETLEKYRLFLLTHHIDVNTMMFIAETN